MTEALIALPLPEALKQIEASGEQLAGVLVTGSHQAHQGVTPRVIRVRRQPHGFELTVAYPSSPSTGAVCAEQMSR